MRAKRWKLCLLTMVFLLLAGCGNRQDTTGPKEPVPDQPTSSEQTKPQLPSEEPEKPEEPSDPKEEEPVPGGINPLTGEPMDPVYEQNRPVAVMFNNIKEAQPQLGIRQADVIYEVPAEGGITRMLGLFQSLEDVDTLGSIRSTRRYYLELAMGYDAIFVHAGASPEAYADIKNWKIDNIDGVNGGPKHDAAFWRDAERRKRAGYEHSLLTSGERIDSFLETNGWQRTHEEGYRYTGAAFTEDGTPINGTPANKITLYYTAYKTGVFQYQAEDREYKISQYGGPHIDGNTGEQIGAVNVLFLETDISRIPGDSEGRLNVRTTGEGKGTYFCGGKALEICWSRKDLTDSFTYTTKDGAELKLGVGNSYVCLMDPAGSRVEIS